MTKYTLVILTIWTTFSTGQNLVPNGDFEQYYNCPTDISQIDSAESWFTATSGTVDYFHECSNSFVNVPNTFQGFQAAHSGSAFGGMYVWNEAPFYQYREYIEVGLDSSLTAGSCYHFEMFINLSNTSGYTITNVDVYFSDTLYYEPTSTTISLTSQVNNTMGNEPDTLNWKLVSGNYTAVGGEDYIIIGNFKEGPLTDTLVYNSSGTEFAYVFIDDVSLTRCPTTVGTNFLDETAISLYPNPFTEVAILKFDNSEKADCFLMLYDQHGQIVRIIDNITTGEVEIERQNLGSGIYFFQLYTDSLLITTGKITIL